MYNTHTQQYSIFGNSSTSAEHIRVSMPVVLNENDVWKPLYDPAIDFGVSTKHFKRHYKQRYYTKGFLKYIIEKLLLRKPKKFEFWVEIDININDETEKMVEELLKKPEVEVIGWY